MRQLLLTGRALRAGYRAGDVVSLPQGRIEALIRESDRYSPGADPQLTSRHWVEDILSYALTFDEASIRMRFTSDATVLGVGRYLRDRTAPLLDELPANVRRLTSLDDVTEAVRSPSD